MQSDDQRNQNTIGFSKQIISIGKIDEDHIMGQKKGSSDDGNKRELFLAH